MLGDGDNIGSRDLSDGDASIGLVRGVQVDVVGSDTSCDCNLQVFGLGKALGGQVTRVESVDVRFGNAIGKRETGAYGVVMMISASTSSLSKVEFSPSLSDVVTSVCPWSSSHLRMPSSFSVVPRSSGTCSIN